MTDSAPPDTSNSLQLPISAKDIQKETVGLDLGKARKEEGHYAARDLDVEAKFQDHDQKQSFKRNIHLGALAGVWVAFACVIAALLVFVWHELTPWGWLSPDKLTELRTFLFSTAVTSMISNYVKPRMQ